MKIVLSETDLLEILSLHLGRTLDPGQVSVRTEPGLEIEIEGAVAVQELGSRAEARVAPDSSGAYIENRDVPRRRTQVEAAEEDEMSMRDLLSYSRDIEAGINARR